MATEPQRAVGASQPLPTANRIPALEAPVVQEVPEEAFVLGRAAARALDQKAKQRERYGLT